MSNLAFVLALVLWAGLYLTGFGLLASSSLNAQAKCEYMHSAEVCFHTLR